MTLNLFRFFTLPHLLREKGNNLLTVTGICLGVAVFVAIEITNKSTLGSFRKSMDSVAGNATIQIDGGEIGIPEEVILNLIDIPGVIRVAPVIHGYPLVGDYGEDIILVQGVDLLREYDIREYKTENGGNLGLAGLTELIEPDSIAICRSFAERKNLTVGDTLVLKYNQRENEMKIRMLLEKEGPSLALGGNFAIMDIASAQEIFDKIGYLDRIDIVSAPDFPIDKLIKDIRSLVPPGLQVKRPDMRNRQIEHILSSFQINLKILSYIAILVGIFLIYNTLNLSVERRRQEIGIMRSIGASRLQIYGMILQEATILGLAGSALGIVLGLFLARRAISFVSRTVTAIYLLSSIDEITLTGSVVVMGMLIGLACTIISSLIPAKRASRIRPHIVIGIYESDNEERPYISSWRLLVISLTFFLGAISFSLLSLKKANPVPGYIAVLLILCGFTCLTPGFIRGFLCILKPLIERYLPIPGKFSIQNLLRSGSRVFAATAALMASLAMLISIAIMVESFRKTVYMWTIQTLKADLYITTAIRFARGTEDRLRNGVREIVKGVEGVAQTGPYRFICINYKDTKIGLASNDFDVFLNRGNIWFKSGDPIELLKKTKAAEGVLISENLELKHGFKPGDKITLNTPVGIKSFLIHGIYYDYTNDLGVVLMDRELYKRVWKDDHISTMGVFLESNADADRVAQDIREELGTSDYLIVMRGQELRDKAMETFRQSFHIFFALEIIAIAIALLGITNSLMISIIHRQREIAVLRSLGALKKQIKQTIVIEAGLIGLIGNILGIFAGVAISLIMIFIITRQSFGWSIQYNPQISNLLISIGPVLITSIMAGYFPACKAAGIPLAKAIRYE